MTPEEYIQLKAFARIDGALVALLWTGSFACYIAGLFNPMWTLAAMFLMLVSPFFVAKRLRLFRDNVREGIISFKRAWAYVVFTFFYGALLLALAQYGYFAFLDHGFLVSSLERMADTAEARQLLSQYGMTETMGESLEQLRAMRPIDLSLNMLTTNLMAGVLLGLPIAAVIRRKRPANPASPTAP